MRESSGSIGQPRYPNVSCDPAYGSRLNWKIGSTCVLWRVDANCRDSGNAKTSNARERGSESFLRDSTTHLQDGCQRASTFVAHCGPSDGVLIAYSRVSTPV